MNSKSDIHQLTARERAKALSSYVEEKTAHLNEASDLIQKQFLEKEIEEIFATAEEVLKDIVGRK